MRPDTPQLYEYITVEHVTAKVQNFININPWTQFFDLKGRTDIPQSRVEHISMRDCDCECTHYFNVTPQEEQYHLSDFDFENLHMRTDKQRLCPRHCGKHDGEKCTCGNVTCGLIRNGGNRSGVMPYCFLNTF